MGLFYPFFFLFYKELSLYLYHDLIKDINLNTIIMKTTSTFAPPESFTQVFLKYVNATTAYRTIRRIIFISFFITFFNSAKAKTLSYCLKIDELHTVKERFRSKIAIEATAVWGYIVGIKKRLATIYNFGNSLYNNFIDIVKHHLALIYDTKFQKWWNKLFRKKKKGDKKYKKDKGKKKLDWKKLKQFLHQLRKYKLIAETSEKKPVKSKVTEKFDEKGNVRERTTKLTSYV